MVVTGIALIAIGAWVGQTHNLLRQLTLEASGTHGMGTAEPIGSGEYRLRLALEHSIFSRSYKGKLRGGDPSSNTEFSIPVVYDPKDPARFLPSGQSYAATAICGLLFLLGMTCVLLARRAAYAAENMQRMSRLRAEEMRKRKKHRHKHRHHHHHHHEHHGTSNRSAH
jgi:hypothetical protein